MANAWEIFKPRPRLYEIRKFSSISRFEHESQKKVSSLPRPRPRFRPRFSDLSFHLQLCPQLKQMKNCSHVSTDCQQNKTKNCVRPSRLLFIYYHYLHIGQLDLAEVIQPELTNYHMTSGSKWVITYLFCIVCLHHKSNIFLLADTYKSFLKLPKCTVILTKFRRKTSFAIISLWKIWVNLLDEARLSEDLIGWEELEGIQELSQRILNNSNSLTPSVVFKTWPISYSSSVPRRLFITALQWLAIAQGPKIS